MKFSICTTNYNCAHILKNHLDSIYSQFQPEEFEYIVVDSKSNDGSKDIFQGYQEQYGNISLIVKKCVRGVGRQIAFKNSNSQFIIQVDTDSIYKPIWKEFINVCMEKYPEIAIQTYDSGIYPRSLLNAVNGWSKLLYYDDFDLWMKIWQLGKMRWYPIWTSEHMKEDHAQSDTDYLSSRYMRFEKLRRFIRSEFDLLQTSKWQKYDLDNVWNENVIDLGLSKIERQLFKNKPKRSFSKWLHYLGIRITEILKS